ncbi:MAG: serine hydrolase [Caldithrix sp.]|nr:serine hydrolase [Caldithrix sp.]
MALACLFIAMPAYVSAQDKATEIDSYLSKAHEFGYFNGTALVAENGDVIYKNGFGQANMDWQIPNKPDTKFRIGSITKQFVATMIMQLMEEGKIQLDNTIIDYLPDYRQDTGKKVTIHHLLNHTSGILPYTSIPGFWTDSTRNHYSKDYMIKHFHSNDLEFEPGSKFKYNNTGYYLLAVIIEKITGKSFEENLKERILKPAGMMNSGVDRNQRILEKRAQGYMKNINGYINEPYFYMPNALGAGDMYSTVHDLYLWDQALHADQLLSEKYKDRMFEPSIKAFGGHYAYGWLIDYEKLNESRDSVLTISHGGGINGFNTLILRLVKDKHLIVLFNNTGPTKLGEMGKSIINILYDRPYNPPKRSLAEKLAKTIAEKDLQAAIDQYHDLKKNHADKYDLSETELNRLGYRLLGQKKIDEAIQIFKLNVEAFPEAYNVYDSLGEAYMVKGNKELAVKNYAKSLQLNPDNSNAINMLAKINKSL